MPAPHEAIELEIPAKPEFVALARLVVSAMASAAVELADEQVDDLKIAVSEACTNAIEAHLAVASPDRIVLRCWASEGALRVAVDDSGPGFDPKRLVVHPPVTHPDRLNFERGLGIPLMRALADELEFVPRERGMTVQMAVWPAGPTGRGDGARDGEGARLG